MDWSVFKVLARYSMTFPLFCPFWEELGAEKRWSFNPSPSTSPASEPLKPNREKVCSPVISIPIFTGHSEDLAQSGSIQSMPPSPSLSIPSEQSSMGLEQKAPLAHSGSAHPINPSPSLSKGSSQTSTQSKHSNWLNESNLAWPMFVYGLSVEGSPINMFGKLERSTSPT